MHMPNCKYTSVDRAGFSKYSAQLEVLLQGPTEWLADRAHNFFREASSHNCPLCTALLSDLRWIGNPINHSSTTVSVSPSCLSTYVFNHTQCSESN